MKRATIDLPPQPRGIWDVTRFVRSAINDLGIVGDGIAHLFIQHTSASLTINENADPDVRLDMEDHMRRLVPDDTSLFRHTAEGPDDMTSHIKASIFGSSLTIPVTNGMLDLGMWQGIHLCEHREHAGSRRVVVTVLT